MQAIKLKPGDVFVEVDEVATFEYCHGWDRKTGKYQGELIWLAESFQEDLEYAA